MEFLAVPDYQQYGFPLSRRQPPNRGQQTSPLVLLDGGPFRVWSMLSVIQQVFNGQHQAALKENSPCSALRHRKHKRIRVFGRARCAPCSDQRGEAFLSDVLAEAAVPPVYPTQ